LIVCGRLIALSLLAAITVPASSALASLPHKPFAVSGSIGIRLVDAKTDSPNNPLARSYIVDRLAPGTTVRRQVEIVNSTRSTANVGVYPAAAASVRGGQFGFAPGHSRNELSSWTSPSKALLRLPPGATAFDTLTIKVPKKASSGERYAVIWAEVSAPAPATGGVKIVNRVGIRMYLAIGPGGAPPSNFTIASLTAKRSATGQPLVVAEIHNSGQSTLGISGTLTLSNGPGGLSAGPFPVNLKAALTPHDTEPATVQLNKVLPRGPWQAHIQLSSGLIQRAAVALIRFPATPAP
jgi:hypothetical protein